MKSCRIDGCEFKVRSRGLCNRHYLKAMRDNNLEQFDGPGRGRYAPAESKSCSGVVECLKKETARGLCNSCYQMRRKIGALALIPKVNAGCICKADGCNLDAKSRGFCISHYEKLMKYGDPLGCAVVKIITGGACNTDGCIGKVVANGVCAACYSRIKKYGDATTYSAWYNRRFEKIVDSKGYVSVYVGVKNGSKKNGREFEHRVVMSEMIGRPLLKNENVHHKNGKRGDNRPENLELWVTSQPSGQRPADLLDWARSILVTYEADEEKFRKM